MSEIFPSSLGILPHVGIAEEALVSYRLNPAEIAPSHSKALAIAEVACTKIVERVSHGPSLYTRSQSPPVEYGEGVCIGMELMTGPDTPWDGSPTELIRLGFYRLLEGSQTLVPFADLRRNQVRTGIVSKPRVNSPADLEDFMAAAKSILHATQSKKTARYT